MWDSCAVGLPDMLTGAQVASHTTDFQNHHCRRLLLQGPIEELQGTYNNEGFSGEREDQAPFRLSWVLHRRVNAIA